MMSHRASKVPRMLGDIIVRLAEKGLQEQAANEDRGTLHVLPLPSCNECLPTQRSARHSKLQDYMLLLFWPMWGLLPM